MSSTISFNSVGVMSYGVNGGMSSARVWLIASTSCSNDGLNRATTTSDTQAIATAKEWLSRAGARAINWSALRFDTISPPDHQKVLNRGPGELADVRDTTFNRCSSDHGRAHQQSSARWTSLTPLEVTIAGRCTHFATFELVGVHREAHRATGFPPFETSGFKDQMQAFFHRLFSNNLRSRHHDRLDMRRHSVPCDNSCGFAKV